MGIIDTLFMKSRQKKVTAASEELRHTLRHPLEVLRAGGEIHDAAYSAIDAAFEAYHVANAGYYIKDEAEFSALSLEYFIYAVQLAAIRHMNHLRGPGASEARLKLAPEVKRRLQIDESPWVRVAGVCVAGAVGDVDLGRRCIDELAARPDLRSLALYFLWTATMAYPGFNKTKEIDELIASTDAVPPWAAESAVPARRRWVLATGGHPVAPEPLTTLAESGQKAPLRVQLRGAWGITDARSAAEVTGRLMNGEVHAIAVAAILSGEIPGQALVLDDRDAYARSCALAYDVGRGVSVTRSCVAVGYLSEAEGWERLDLAGAVLAETYTGWDDFCVDFQLGRIFQNGKKDPDDPYHKMMDWMRTDPRSPWRSLTFGNIQR